MKSIISRLFVVAVLGVFALDECRAAWQYIEINPNNRSLCPETPETRPSNRVNTTDRIAHLRSAMNNITLTGGSPLDAYLVLLSDDHGSSGSAWDSRLQYMTGFSGSAGYALITRNQTALWTDGRYFLQADMEMDCNWILMTQGQSGYPTGEEWLLAVLPNNALLGAYPNYVSISTWQSYQKVLFEKATLVGMDEDLVDIIWTDPDRPPRPNNPPFVHTIEFAGVTWQTKLSQVREKFAEQNADAFAVTILEESAWLFNLRGTDQTSSLFFAYSIVLPNEARLFLNNYLSMIASTELQDHLQIQANGTCRTPGLDCINVFDYSTIMTHIEELASRNLSVWLDTSANYATYDAAGIRRLVLRSPIALMKSIKNAVEKVKFAECIMRDSAALIEFLAFLENEIAAGKQWTEVTAADRLQEIRSTYPNYKGISFDTISAVGPHASIIHYMPNRSNNETNSPINTEEVYLLDSGGQYLDGTTDVTRTLHYGTPSAIIKEAYTIVLKGNIDLAETIWPEGLYGNDFDARARAPLWKNGWDYNHGTGHGIGYYLSVHEGPGRIGMGYSSQSTPIYEGMFFSDEPGYYEDNYYGIRLETLVQVVKANTTNHFNGKKFIGFHPVTLVPYEPKLIDYDSLTLSQKNFLNKYNQRCLDEVGPYLRDIRKNQEAYDWLLARVQPILTTNPLTSASHQPALSSSLLFLNIVLATIAVMTTKKSF